MKASFAAFNISNATIITNMLQDCNINDTGTTTNYDNTLIAWAALNLVNSLTLTATNCKYGGDASSGGQQARTAIATDDLWTFVDGGHI
jgi:ABC-type polar amino acid transport system ATPase subunit